MNANQLREYTLKNGTSHLKTRQVAKRLRVLLVDRLGLLTKEYRATLSPGRSLRAALMDDRYKDAIEEYVTISRVSLEAKVNWETHQMLISALKIRA